MNTQKQLSDRPQASPVKDERTYDYLRPKNPSIPFFRSQKAYLQHPKPHVPAGFDLETMRAWLVQPGLNSFEVYEAIFRIFFGQYKSFTRYICEAGIVQARPIRERSWKSRTTPRCDFSGSERRDVCFILLSSEESELIRRVLQEYDVDWGSSPFIATPYHPLLFIKMRRSAAEAYTANTDHQLLVDLGLHGSTFPMSILPPGVRPVQDFPYQSCHEWRLSKPGETSSSCGLATCVDGFERINWLNVETRDLIVLPVRERPSDAISADKGTESKGKQ